MQTLSEQNAAHRTSISAKAAYSKAAHRKLFESRAKLDGARAKIKNAVATGRIEASEQLEHAQQAVESNLHSAEVRLERLRKSGEEDWEALRDDIDSAWEDLSRSIKKLVDRFSDGAR